MLQLYLLRFQQLKVAKVDGMPAPHKPLLLLAIMQLVERGIISDNKIEITAELVAQFKDLFSLLADERFTANFALPFYHLQSNGFWHLKTHSGMEIALTSSRSIRSFAQLKEVVAYGCFDDALWEIMMQQAGRKMLRATLMQRYFPNCKELVSGRQSGLFDTVAKQILEEPAVLYQAQVAAADDEELFVRSGVFKCIVPKVYNNTCCISSMRLTAARAVQMIDACHIIPFAASRNDTIGNGLSLCPNLHRAFDRFLIAIDGDYRVRVAGDIAEEGAYGLMQFEGKEILLPADRKYWPGRENLEWHWRAFNNGN